VTILPPNISYRSLKNRTFPDNSPGLTDWSQVEHVDFAELPGILLDASLRPSNRWGFRPPESTDIDDLAFRAKLAAPSAASAIQRELETSARAGRTHRLYPDTWKASHTRMMTIARDPNVLAWLNAELLQRGKPDVIGFLDRTAIVARALEIGVDVDPFYHEAWRVTYGSRVAMLELTPISAPEKLALILDNLSDARRLKQLFGRFVDLDALTSGALADIVVTELGNNATEHAKGSLAWVAARVVDLNLHPAMAKSLHDPCYASFVDTSTSFVEVNVADNGSGFAATLTDHLSKDERRFALDRFGEPGADRITDENLVMYAFDRLTSSRRSPAEILSMATSDAAGKGVASGLYWIWNLVRSHRGAIAVRLGKSNTWYDFRRPGPETIRSESFPVSGFSLKILLPAARTSKVLIRTIPASSSPASRAAGSPSSLAAPRWRYLWLGEVAAGLFTAAHARDREPILANELLHRLLQYHADIGADDILIIDVCGMRDRWAKEFTSPLCSALVDLNYTASASRSTVVLANIPERSIASFELAAHEAYHQMQQLRALKRPVLFVTDAGRPVLVSEDQSLQSVFSHLDTAGGATTDELVTATGLSHSALRRLLRQNDHLFVETDSSVIPRVASSEIMSFVVAETLKWYESIVDTPSAAGGILLDTDGYYRLPATGLLSQRFYHFRRLFSDHEWSHRVVWLLSRVIAAVERRFQRRIDVLVSVTRASLEVTRTLAEHYGRLTGRSILTISGATFADLVKHPESTSVAGRHAVFFTSVVSTGSTAVRVAAALRTDWIATVACLDARRAAGASEDLSLAMDVSIPVRAAVATGPVMALVARCVDTISPDQCAPGRDIVAIDEVNVSPIRAARSLAVAEHPLWNYVSRSSGAVEVGHIEEASYHHYVYYLDPARLFWSEADRDEDDFLAKFASMVEADVRGIDPDTIVVLHPPAEHSYGEILGRAVQARTGARYRLGIYRDRFAGQWRFSTFLDHLLPLDKATVIIVDDGANSGETLMGLLNTTSVGRPARVLAYIAISRLPIHKALLFRGITSTDWCSDVKVRIMFECDIPVFAPRACPLCRAMTGLSGVRATLPLLQPSAATLLRRLAAGPPHQNRPPLFVASSPSSAAELREAIERHAYDERALRYLGGALANVASNSQLLDFLFIAATEPEVFTASLFAPVLKPLLDAVLHFVKSCAPAAVSTAVCGGFRLLTELARHVSPRTIDEIAGEFARATYKRVEGSIDSVAEVVALVMADIFIDAASEHTVTVALSWLRCLDAAAGRRHPADLSALVAQIHVAEASRLLYERTQTERPALMPDSGRWLFEQARQVASEYWWHSSEFVIYRVETIRRLIRESGDIPVLQSLTRDLIRSIAELYNLRAQLRAIEEAASAAVDSSSDSTMFWNEHVEELAARFATAVLRIANSLQSEPTFMEGLVEASDELSSAWGSLYLALKPVFSDLFPEVVTNTAHFLKSAPETADLAPSQIRFRASAYQSDRCFLPSSLLTRFLRTTISNLRTVAFVSLDGEVRRDARARITVVKSRDDQEQEVLCVRLSDNGARFRDPEAVPVSEEGRHIALAEIRRLAAPFGATVSEPVRKRKSAWTSVTLTALKKPGV
jgi:hypothetical protein